MTGIASGADFPTTAGAIARRGDDDSFVTKLAPDGGALAWSTFLGVAATAWGVAPDVQGRALVVGEALAVPVRKAFQADNRGAFDAFLMRVDPRTAPSTAVTGPAVTADTRPTFTFSGGASYECSIDFMAFAPCASPFTTGPLSEGAHQFAVRALDADGFADPSPAEHAFRVDTTAPDSFIIDDAPPFTFFASETASFECRVDGGAWTVCASPFSPGALPPGTHGFEARARDEVGNIDPSPGRVTWQVAAPSAPSDRDGDGVPDANDECPDTAGTPAIGCPPVDTDPDSDGDGVRDTQDACPTIRAATTNGCPGGAGITFSPPLTGGGGSGPTYTGPVDAVNAADRTPPAIVVRSARITKNGVVVFTLAPLAEIATGTLALRTARGSPGAPRSARGHGRRSLSR